MTKKETKPIKAFISYSWSSPKHKEWVRNLATMLCGNGVDVKLDEWEINEGDELTAFMESMETDPEISKVIIVADKAYVEKANARLLEFYIPQASLMEACNLTLA